MTSKNTMNINKKLMELTSNLPEYLKDDLIKEIAQSAATKDLKIIKEWIEQYEGHPVDILVAKLLSSVLIKFMGKFMEHQGKMKEKGETEMRGIVAAEIAEKSLREV